MNTYTLSIKDAENMARKYKKETGQKHVVRSFALGNKVAYQVVNVERFQ